MKKVNSSVATRESQTIGLFTFTCSLSYLSYLPPFKTDVSLYNAGFYTSFKVVKKKRRKSSALYSIAIVKCRFKLFNKISVPLHVVVF